MADKNRTSARQFAVRMFGFCLVYSPLPYGVKPLIFEVEFSSKGELLLESTRIRRISRTEALIESALVDTRLRPAAEKIREQEKEGI